MVETNLRFCELSKNVFHLLETLRWAMRAKLLLLIFFNIKSATEKESDASKATIIASTNFKNYHLFLLW